MTAEKALRKSENARAYQGTAPLDKLIEEKISAAAEKGRRAVNLVNMGVRTGYLERQSSLLRELGYTVGVSEFLGTLDIAW